MDGNRGGGGDGALGQTSETLDERIAAVLDELGDVRETPAGELTQVRRGSTLFAVIGPRALEVRLDSAVASAALKTPDVTPSSRGPGWVVLRPADLRDRFALDRAEAWLRVAHRRATAG
ncbi:MAG: hypothetical protein ACJ77N_07305 [Chloroflexota bacterium]|jgi:hypothetical protein